MRHLLASAVLLSVALPAPAGVIAGYVAGDPASIATYDRFPNGLDSPTPNTSTGFVAHGLDLSGIGLSLTLIAPQYAVGAWHVGQGGSASFVNNSGQTHTFGVQQSYRLTTNGIGSDIRLVRLTAPVDTATTGIRPAGIADVTATSVAGLSLLAYGQNSAYNTTGPGGVPEDRRHFGRGLIAGVDTFTFTGGDSPTRSVFWDHTGTTPGTMRLIGGDSGNAALLYGADGVTPAILGAHMGAGSAISASTFLPEYVGQINTILSDNGDLPLVLVVPVPEPAGLLVAAGLGLAAWRRWAA